MMRTRRMVMVGATVGALSLLGASTAFAGTYPPPPDDVVIEWPTNADGAGFIEPGQSFTFTICCFTPGAEVYITIDVPDSQLSAQAHISIARDGTLTVKESMSITMFDATSRITCNTEMFLVEILSVSVAPSTSASTVLASYGLICSSTISQSHALYFNV